MPSALMDTEDSVQDQICNITKEVNAEKTKIKEILKIKNTVMEIEDPFNGLISKSDMTKNL